MKTNEHQLLKHFAIVLRNRANGNNEPISPTLLKYLSRKDLVEVIRKIHNGTIPKGLDLTLMENEELLAIIKDEMFVISFITEKWIQKPQKVVPKKENQKSLSNENKELIVKMDATISKAVDKDQLKSSTILKNQKNGTSKR